MTLRLPAFLLLFPFLLSFSPESEAQTRRIVYFANKGNNSFSLSSPAAFLSNRALQRKNKYGIKPDSTDLPVSAFYTDSILKMGNLRLLGTSRWLNAALLQSDDPLIWDRIRAVSFVQTTEVASLRVSGDRRFTDKWLNEQLQPLSEQAGRTASTNANFQYGAGATQINLHNGSFLHRMGATGSPMLFSFMDAGYTNYLSNPFLDTVRLENRIIATKDFVSGGSSVNSFNQHGLNCFTITAGYKPGTFIGSCPDASFILLRTEDAATEYLIEEFNWVMGAEYADSCGTDIISSSLGYTTFDLPAQDHRYSDMDGNTTIISRGADIAAKKGILVVTSAGNDGASAWKFICAPADADSVLTVGAVNASGIIAGFSSFGPTADGRTKPDVAGMGQATVLSNSAGGLSQGSGTSFSTPVVAGLAGCLWQVFPEINNYQLIEVLRKSSDRFLNPQAQYGFGIPDMRKAVGLLLAEQAELTHSVSDCKLTLNWSSKDMQGMRYLVERKSSGETAYSLVEEKQSVGTSFLKRSYSFTDKQAPGLYTYRISQVIDTINAQQITVALDSVTIAIPSDCAANESKALVQLYPNPAENETTLQFLNTGAEEKLVLRVVSARGEQVIQKVFSKPAGIFSLKLNISHLQPGIYFLEVRKGNKIYGVAELIKSGKN